MPSMISNTVSTLMPQRQLVAAQQDAMSSARKSAGLAVNAALHRTNAAAALRASMADPVALNTSAAVSGAQVLEAHLSSTGVALQQMREIAQQSSDSSLSAADRDALNAEFSTLKSEVFRIGEASSKNGGTLAVGTAKLDQSQVALVGSGASDDGILTRSYDGYSLASGSFNVSSSSTQEQRKGMLGALDSMISNINTARYAVASFQSEVTSTASQSASYSAPEDDGLYGPFGFDTPARVDIDTLRSRALESWEASRSEMFASQFATITSWMRG